MLIEIETVPPFGLWLLLAKFIVRTGSNKAQWRYLKLKVNSSVEIFEAKSK
jgi:hypothetical protein